MSNVVCTKCGTAKDRSEFYPCKAKRNGLNSWCKRCKNRDKLRYNAAYLKRRLAVDPDYLNRYMRNYNRKRYAEDSAYRKRMIRSSTEYIKKRYATDPEFRQRLIDNAAKSVKRRYRSDPAFRQRMIDNSKEYCLRNRAQTSRKR
jgi:hypothetical protein